jgi:hypothetical protein
VRSHALMASEKAVVNFFRNFRLTALIKQLL